MEVVTTGLADRVQAYITRYTPRVQVPRIMLHPLPPDDEVLSVQQRMYSFSKGDSGYKRYLETTGLSTCIGLTVYDPKTKVGCIAHLDNDNEINPRPADMASPFLLDLAHVFKRYQSLGPYQVRMVGGWKGLSEQTLLPLFETLDYL